MCQYHYGNWDTPPSTNDCADYIEACAKLERVEQAARRLVQILYSNVYLEHCQLDDAVCQICDAVDIDSPNGLPRVNRSQRVA